jgi:GTP-binding protein HflX
VFVNTRVLPLKVHQSLEEAWDCEVVDRFSLILRIFAQRARTRESQLSVELASLGYKRGHLVASEAGYDQQRGGMMSISGSGESALEKQRRIIFDREHKLKQELASIEKLRTQAQSMIPFRICI